MSGSPEQPLLLGNYCLVRPLGDSHTTFLGLDLDRLWPDMVCTVKKARSGEKVPSMTSLLTAGTSHPGLVRLLHVSEVDGQGLMVMEYVSGMNLSQVNALEGPRPALPVLLSLFVGQQICRALSYLHASAKIEQIHGRVEPKRVLLAFDGRVKLTGVQFAGSPEAIKSLVNRHPDGSYKAPEFSDDEVLPDIRVDIFSVGALLWELLTGRSFEVPLDPPARKEALARLTPPSVINPDVPDSLDEIVISALKPDPSSRPPTAAALGQLLVQQAQSMEGGNADATTLAIWMERRCSKQWEDARKEKEELQALVKELTVPKKKGEKIRSSTPSEAFAPKDDGSKGAGKPKDAKPKKKPPKTEPSKLEDLVETVLDNRYQIHKLLGEGGMGKVYEGEHVQIGKRVAVKVLHPLYSSEPEVVERFRREARAATAIGHPNIVDVTDSGSTPDGRAFFVMELLEGMELADVIIEQKWLDPYRSAHIAIQICQALGTAHKAGIIHRDLKPENIFLTFREGRPDFVKILDFGIAKSAKMEMSRGGGLTQPGLAMGTPEYMAPEQAAGKPADPRVDIYATGGILYAMLVGRPPHQGGNIMEILTKKATESPRPLREYRPELPEELESLVLSTLATKPQDRPQTMEQLEYLLRKFLSGRGSAVAALLGLEHLTEAPFKEKPELEVQATPPLDPDLALAKTQHAGIPTGEIPTLPEVSEGPKPLHRTLELDLEDAEEVVEDEQPQTLQRRTPERAHPAHPELSRTDSSPPVAFLKSVTVPVVKRQPKSRGWVWLLLILIVVAGAAGLAVYLKYRAPEKERSPKSSVASVRMDATAGRPSARGAERPVDAGLAPATDSGVDRTDAAPQKPALTPKEIDKLAFDAFRAAKKGRWASPKKSSALYYLTELERVSPKHPGIKKVRKYASKVLMYKGTKLQSKSRWERAENAYRNLLALTPDDQKVKDELVKVLNRRARESLARGSADKAQAQAAEALMLDGSSHTARFYLATALERLRNYEQSLEEWRKLKDSKAPWSLRKLARKAISRLKKKVK